MYRICDKGDSQAAHLPDCLIKAGVLFGFICSLALSTSVFADDSVDANGALFLSSGRWYQFQNDKDSGIFRMYATLMNQKVEVIDLPNLFLLKCKAETPYVTLHFPSNYNFKSFTSTDWLPETRLYARNQSETYKFSAELNKNELYIDLPQNSKQLSSMLSSRLVELRFGVNAEDSIRLGASSELFDAERNILLSNPDVKKIASIVTWEEIRDCAHQPPRASTRNYRFSSFPAKEVFKGKVVLPDFTGRDKSYKSYRTRIIEGMRNGPNFAGEFSIVEVGCGTGCRQVFISNNRTGQVFSFTDGKEEKLYLKLLYDLNSTIIAAQWASAEQGKCYLEYFNFTGSNFDLLQSNKIGETDACFKNIRDNASL